MDSREILIDGRIKYATFQSRPNRFLVNLVLENSSLIEQAFLHDPGRMKELLVPHARLLIRKPLKTDTRKTSWDILAVEYRNILVPINSQLPNIVVQKALRNGWIPELKNYTTIQSEVPINRSRLDFLLTDNMYKCYVEVKGVTLVEESVALFPDAPTSRGARHLLELIKLKREGNRAVILFVCMREDSEIFSPNVETDPLFAKNLLNAVKSSVEVFAYKIKPKISGSNFILQFMEKIKVRI